VSDIDTVCNFDPIAVGNRWIYKGAINRIQPTRIDSVYYFREVIQEIEINNKTYKAIINN
jgi:hypothetical protein